MKAKKVLACVLASAMVMGLGVTAFAEEGGDQKITVWAWDETFNIKAANEAAEIYKAEHPDVVLIEDYKIQGYLTSYPDEFADFSDVLNPEDFAAYKTGVNVVDGSFYGVPFDSGVAATFYARI